MTQAKNPKPAVSTFLEGREGEGVHPLPMSGGTASPKSDNHNHSDGENA